MQVVEKNSKLELLLKFETMARYKYEEELRREESIIAQASNMQTAFAVLTAALFMLLPVVVENRGNISLNLIFGFTSIISLLLLASLMRAIMAQKRALQIVLPSIDEINKKINEGEIKIDSVEDLLAYNVKCFQLAQEKRFNTNGDRVRQIQKSMLDYNISLGLCIVYYAVAIIYLYC